MRSLSALRPAAGLCPVKFDGLELVELDLSYLFSISPFPGFEKKMLRNSQRKPWSTFAKGLQSYGKFKGKSNLVWKLHFVSRRKT